VLVKFSETEHVLLLVMHHLIADGGSLFVFLRELAALYASRLQSPGRPQDVLPPLPIQYADFARWQQQWLDGGERERQLEYWKAHLAGAPAALELPTDRPRPPIQSSRGAAEARILAPDLSESVRTLSNAEGVTPFMTLLAAFQVLLQRYSAQDDLLIGTPVSNRNRIETESLIGFFVNTVVLRGNLAGSPSFRELLARTRDEVVHAVAHQELPFETLLDSRQLRRDPSRTPL